MSGSFILDIIVFNYCIFVNTYGYGRIDAFKAVELAKNFDLDQSEFKLNNELSISPNPTTDFIKFLEKIDLARKEQFEFGIIKVN